MTERILRLGIDPRPAEQGSKKYVKAVEDAKDAARGLADTVEAEARREQRMREEHARAEREHQRKKAQDAKDAAAASAEASRQAAEAEIEAAQRRATAERRFFEDIERMEEEHQAKKKARAQESAAVSAEAGRQQARAQVQALELQFRAETARIKEAQARGFLTPAEAQAAGRESAVAYNQGVLRVIDAQRGSGSLTRGAAGNTAFADIAGSLKNVNEAGRKAGLGLGEMRESMASLAAQSVGAHPVLGRLVNVMGSFAMGGAMTMGVLGGIAAIGLAMRLMGEDAKEARERQEELLGTLEDLAERRRIDALGPGGEFVEPMAATESRIAEIRDEIADRQARMEQMRAQLEGMANSPVSVRDAGTLPASSIEQALREQEDAVADLAAELHKRNQALRAGREETEEARAEADKAAAEEAKRLAEEKEKERLRAEGRRAMMREVEASAETLRNLDGLLESMESRADSLRLDIAFARSAEEAGKLNRELTAVLRQMEQINEERVRQMLTPGVGVTGAAGTLDGGQFGMRSFNQRSGLALPEYQGGFGLDDLITPERLEPLDETASAMEHIAQGARVAAPLLGDFGGAITSIASGIAAGGAMGIGSAVVSGVTFVLDELLAGGVKAQQAANEWERALSDFADAFEPMTEWQQAMQQAEREFLQVAQQGAAAAGWDVAIGSIEDARAFVDRYRGTSVAGIAELVATLDQALAAYDQHVDGLQDLLAEQEAFFEEDLDVRMLRAQGLDEEADALAFAIKQERELAKAREQYGADSEVVAYLEQVQAAEAAAEAMKDLNDAMLSVTTALNAPQGLNMALLTYNAGLTGTRPSRDGRITSGGGLDYERRGRDTGNTYNIEINVTGAPDSRETARMVMEEWRREAATGGGDPLEVTTR